MWAISNAHATREGDGREKNESAGERSIRRRRFSPPASARVAHESPGIRNNTVAITTAASHPSVNGTCFAPWLDLSRWQSAEESLWPLD